jgi:hypothetical protein
MATDKADRLFLRVNSIESGRVRAAVDFDAVTRDDFRGKEGQELRVFTALSGEAEKEILERFGISGKKMPVLLAYDGAIIEQSKNVIMHLRRNGMVKS